MTLARRLPALLATVSCLPGLATAAPRPATPALIRQAVTAGALDEASGRLYLAYAFTRYDLVPEAYRSDTPWDGTLPLHELRRELAAMPGGARRDRIEALLAGTCSGVGAPLPSTVDSPHFHIQHEPIGGGLAIDDYVAALETAWVTQIDQFGHVPPPVLPANPPPGNRYHVRVEDLGGGLYGYVDSDGDHAGHVGDNPATSFVEDESWASCMALHSDFSQLAAAPLENMQATVGHEFHHSVQFGMSAFFHANEPAASWYEGLAMWIEDETFDDADANHEWLWPEFELCMGDYRGDEYLYWPVYRAMTEPYGTAVASGGEDVIQEYWDRIARGEESLDAFAAAFASAGTTLADAYHDAAIALRFLRGCSGGYVTPHCLEEGPGWAATSGPTSSHGALAAVPASVNLDLRNHYALNWLDLPIGTTYAASIENTDSAGELRASIVCDTGSELRVTPFPQTVGGAERADLAAYDATGCVEVVAVITNQEQTSGAPRRCPAQTYRFALDVPSCASSQLEIVRDVRCVKRAPDVFCSWSADPMAPGYHLNSVAAKDELLDPRLDPGNGAAECTTAAPALGCADPGVLAAGPARLYYQALSACGPNGADEGPF